ncbi:hypothetical protein K1T71_012931 [Dendrolimus kikuchii]|uniref:Uncharacterized protein n=1 Tax=Dendrolimus kikuchii TaxID=765133 RepID=A0ACC1CIP3_9NEOP|nr:hypothetical protein K1T71_012931 [Dendrolimus kikuchii]
MSQNPNKREEKKDKNGVHKQVQKKSPDKNMSEIDEHILKRFEIKKRLGKGAYGIVWKATDKKTKEVVAIKKIFDAFRNQTDAQRTFREIIFLQSFRNHPNIVKLHSIHRALNNRDIYLGFEYMETDLHNVIKRGNILKDIHKRYIMYQMLKATKYIHSGNVIHRDQKPSNVLIDSACRVKLADFGLARSVSSIYSGGEDGADPCLTDYVATRWYRAPEILIASKNYTKGIDMWSLGCILGEMLTGKPLFPGTSTVNQVERIMAALPRPSPEDISAVCNGYGSALIREQASINNGGASLSSLLSCAPRDAADLVQRLLVFNPAKRLSAQRALDHEYVAKFHRERDEPTLPSDVLLPLRDDKQMSVDDYRNKLYSIMARNPNNVQPPPLRKTHTNGNKTHPLPTTTSKSSKCFHDSELSKSYTKTKHMSVSADQKVRVKKPERPLKEYRSEQSVAKPLRAVKAFDHHWHQTPDCHGDYFQPVTRQSPSEAGVMSGGKKINVQQRRNSTSFSTVTIGGDADYGIKQRHGVITASALMDLRTIIYEPRIEASKSVVPILSLDKKHRVITNRTTKDLKFLPFIMLVDKDKDTSEYWRETEILSLVRSNAEDIDYETCARTPTSEDTVVQFPSRRTVRPICKSQIDYQLCPQCPHFNNHTECELFRDSCKEKRVPTSIYRTYCDNKYGKWRTMFVPADYSQCRCCDECIFYRELDQSCIQDEYSFEAEEFLPVTSIDFRAGCNPYWGHPEQESRALRCDQILRRCVPVSVPTLPNETLNIRRSYRFEPPTDGKDCPFSCRGYECIGGLVPESNCAPGAFLPDKKQCNCCGRCSAYHQLNQKCAEFKKIIHKVNGSKEIEVEEEFLEPGCDDGLVCRQGRCQDIHTVQTSLGGRRKRAEGLSQAYEPCKQELKYFKKKYGSEGHLHYNAPQCTPLWLYAPVQCRRFVCYCALEDGSFIQGIKVPRVEVSNMNCDCAREKCRTGSDVECDGYGNYKDAVFVAHVDEWAESDDLVDSVQEVSNADRPQRDVIDSTTPLVREI